MATVRVSLSIKLLRVRDVVLPLLLMAANRLPARSRRAGGGIIGRVGGLDSTLCSNAPLNDVTAASRNILFRDPLTGGLESNANPRQKCDCLGGVADARYYNEPEREIHRVSN